MKDKTYELFSFIQQRYLWQFHSRAWDRVENINGIMAQATEMLKGKETITGTAKEKCFYADAKIFVAEAKEKFSWLNEINDAEKNELMEAVKEKLIEVTVTNSLNGELNISVY